MSKILHLAQGRILVEQLRLLLGNVGSSAIPAILLALLLVWVLSNDSNALALKLWCAAVIFSKLYCTYDARRILASNISFDRARRLVWRLIVLNAIDGMAWGTLAWVTMDTTSVAGSVLVVAVLAGIAGSSMSLLSPVFPVFVVFIAFELIVLVFKLWLLGDPAYNALSIAGILYTATLLGQARNSANVARASLELRFENVELIERLSKEKESALAAHQEAEQANIAKSRFLAAASHDLRQPIHAQGLFLDVLSRTNLTVQQHELITSSCAANEASAEMLNTLLDFSRIEAGVIEPQVQPFHLQPLLNKIEREFAPQADAKGLSYRSRETSLVVQSDPALLELMMRNLVSNAIRYTDHGGLLVAFRKSGDKAVLEVRDTGIGIDPSQQRDVFREFHQLGNPERDRNKGLGLGLAIVAGLSRTLKHNVSLASTQHRGSVFRVTLPIATTALPATLTTKVSSQTKKLNMRVLVVDDDEVIRASMLHLLRDWGCDCEAADSIEEAIVLAQLNVPDVIISDYRLREQRTGAEAITTLRKVVGNPYLPALLITGDTAPERLREAHASGIPLLHKPVSPGLLSSKLATILLD